MELKSILCPIDFSDFSATAYQHALSLAEYYNARIIALHVVELWKYPFADYAAHEADYAKFSAALNEGGEVKLQRFIREYSFGTLQPELVIHQGNAPNCILSFAQKENIEVIVMGTHGRRGFDRLVLGSTTDRVMRKAACPVLVVSSPSQTAMAENASDLVRADAIIAERSQELDKLISETERKNFKLKTVVRFGKAYEEIVRYAKEGHTSLIIMSSRGGDAVDRAVFGSTTYRVIQLGPCPVLAIHT